MIKSRTSNYLIVICLVSLCFNFGARGQGTTKKPGSLIVPKKNIAKQDKMIKSYDYRVSLNISDLGGDRYKLTATIINDSNYDHEKGGTLLLTREGHGVPLPARPGEKVTTMRKWGQQRIAEWLLPAIKAGQSIEKSVETNGRGEFSACVIGVFLESNTTNNRSVTSNLMPYTYRIMGDELNNWFFPKDGPATTATSRLHGSSGFFEIPGFISKTTFGLPREGVLPPLGVRIAISANDINITNAPYKDFPYGVWLDGGRPDSIGRPTEPQLWFRVNWEMHGPIFLQGGDVLMMALTRDVFYLAGGGYPDYGFSVNSDLQIRVGFVLKYDSAKQLFRLEGRPMTKFLDLDFRLSTDGKNLSNNSGLKAMYSEISRKIRSNIAAAVEKKRVEIEWNINRKMRELCLTDKFGNSGKIERVSLDFDRIYLDTRLESIPNSSNCGSGVNESGIISNELIRLSHRHRRSRLRRS